MKTWLRWIGGLVLLAMAYLGIIRAGVLPRPTDEQRQALAKLDAPRPKLGERDGFGVIWTSLYDVPLDQVEQVTAEDVAAWNARIGTLTPPSAGYVSVAKSRYAVLEHPSFPARDPHLCHAWTSGCLAMVRADPDAVQAALARVAVFSAHAARLATADHVSYPMTPTIDSPIPNVQGFIEVSLTPAALTAVRGDPAAALTALCRDATLWRRLRSHSDTLIVDMVGVALLSGAAQLAGDLLAELPPGADWPPECTGAFAALATEEFDQCNEILTEGRLSIGLIDHLDPGNLSVAGMGSNRLMGMLADLGLNRPHARHKVAGVFAAACSDAARAAHAARQPTPAIAPEDADCGRFEMALDPTGCVLFMIAIPDFSGYSRRVIDLDGRYAALRTARWLRSQHGDAAALVDGRPNELVSHHNLVVDPVARTLTLNSLEQVGGPEQRAWAIPYRLAGEELERP